MLLLSIAALTWASAQAATSQAESPDHGEAQNAPAQGPAPDMPDQGELYDPTSLLLGLEPGVSLEQIHELLAAHDLEFVRHWPELNIVQARLSPELVFAASDDLVTAANQRRAGLEAGGLLRYAEFDGIVQIAVEPPELEPSPNDPLANQQWALNRINVRQAWDITHGDPTVTVAVIDTGYHARHEDFALDNLWRNPAEFAGLPGIDDDANGFIDDIHGWDWVNNDNGLEDENGHGSHIKGTIVAATNNNKGVSGLGRAVRVAPLRIFGPTGSGRISDLIAAIDYGVNMQIPVLNLSLTTASDSPSLRAAVNRAAQAGILVVSASGNMSCSSSSGQVLYPAAYPSTLAVAATTPEDTRACFSRHGPTVDVAAPGDRILSTWINDEYRSISGTSMATAHVSALAALLLSLRPDLNAVQVQEFITSTAVDVNSANYSGKDSFLGHGRIDMAAALLEASRALTVTTDSYTAAPNGQQPEARFTVRVTAPGPDAQSRLPVRNAALHYRVSADASASKPAWQRLFTNANGEVSIPIQISLATAWVEMQVGAVEHAVEVTVLPDIQSLSLTFASTAPPVGSAPISYTLSILDQAGQIIPASIPIELTTTLGLFENDSKFITARLVDGQYTGTFSPSTKSGTARIDAAVGPYQTSQTLYIPAGAAHTISSPTTSFPEVSISSNSVALQFMILDQFGNPVEDGVHLELFAGDGVLVDSIIETTNGRAATVISLPSPQTQTISVWAVIPNGGLETRVDIPVIRIRRWFPSLSRNAPIP